MAGLGRRTFAAGEVLTAGNVMGYLQDQAVMNFAGTAARGSAIGTAVSEGMISYLADTNVVQAYTGSSWNSLAYASAVSAIPTVGLTPVIAPTVNYSGGTATANSLGKVSFTAVTSLSLNNVFTSTYDNYRFIIEVPTTSTTSNLLMRFRTGGVDNTVAYYAQFWMMSRTSGATQTNNGASLSTIGLINWLALSNRFISVVGVVTNPALVKTTNMTWQGFGYDGTSAYQNNAGGLYDNTVAFDGFTIYASAGTMTGSVTVFGYND